MAFLFQLYFLESIMLDIYSVNLLVLLVFFPGRIYVRRKIPNYCEQREDKYLRKRYEGLEEQREMENKV
jgi:hypothetical protein